MKTFKTMRERSCASHLDDGEAVAGAVLDGAPAALCLVARPVLRLGLADHLQLHAPVPAHAAQLRGEGDDALPVLALEALQALHAARTATP